MSSTVPHATLADAFVELHAALNDPGTAAVLEAPPGTGKTTLVPLELLRAPWAAGGRIVVLEPRRLATRAAARRMAHLLGEEPGSTVGYTTRDERRVGAGCRIEVVTEGVLTRRLQRDRTLPGVALVVFDEVHERNLQTDLGLALALDSRATVRPDLRLLAMSATLATDRLAELLGAGAPAPARVVRAGGAPYPVEVHWFPRRPKDKLAPAVANVVTTALRRHAGDALVFLPGEREIGRVASLLEQAGLPDAGIDVHRLFGAAGSDVQDAALRPSPPGRRRVVLSTDIAESSLTVDGVHIVVDAGLSREPRFDVRSGLTRLETVPASRASAEQRAGRAGRLGPGVVYRCWSKGEHATRRADRHPELLQVDLAGFALELAVWGAQASDLAFLDPPPERTLADARALLGALGALDGEGRVTALGSAMNELPLHPRLARMVRCAGSRPFDDLTACAVAALLEERDVLRGRSDELPTDLTIRLALMGDSGRRHAALDVRSLETARRRARELLRRSGAQDDDLEMLAALASEDVGRVLVLAYPDRVAVRRSRPGRFQLVSGGAAWVPAGDELAGEEFVVAADLDGDRTEARLRLGAAFGSADVADVLGATLDVERSIEWDPRRDELVERVRRRLGGMVLDELSARPEPGAEVTRLLVERVRDRGLDELRWSADATALRRRVAFLNRAIGAPWPDWSDTALRESLDDWLTPFLAFACGRSDLEALDPGGVLRARLDHTLLRQLDELAPAHVTVRSGRRFALDYEREDAPTLRAAVQELFGTTETPTVARGTRVVLELLSPAGRPLQITSDLAGFWAGSWSDVRKEMAGRYPKHSWPTDPASAAPPERRGRH